MTTGNDARVRPHEAVTLLLVTWACVHAYWWASARAGRLNEVVSVEALIKLAVWAPACLLTLWLMRRRGGPGLFDALGLSGGASRGLLFGFLATLPMLAGVVLLPSKDFDWDLVLGSAVIGPIAEELLFRGFLFRHLRRFAGWSLPVAVLVSSILFGLAHVRNIDFDLWTALRGPDQTGFEAVFSGSELVRLSTGAELWWRHLTTRVLSDLSIGLAYAAGGVVFAWIVHRWNSLWPAIALHGFMNLWWDMTRGEHARLGYNVDLLSAAQALSIVLAVILTIRWTRPQKEPGD